MQDGTVVGNVSRSHYPCAVCRELVETCQHYRRPAVIAAARAKQRDIERRVREQAARAVAEFRGDAK